MENNIETSGGGLQCDNPNCDWKDTTIKIDETLIGMKCPKCGENVLTEEDYVNAMFVEDTIKMINSVSPEVLAQMFGGLDKEAIEGLKNSPLMKEAEGLENLDNLNENDEIGFTINMHKGIKVEKIEKKDKPE
jgi:hypothetical protein